MSANKRLRPGSLAMIGDELYIYLGKKRNKSYRTEMSIMNSKGILRIPAMIGEEALRGVFDGKKKKENQ